MPIDCNNHAMDAEFDAVGFVSAVVRQDAYALCEYFAPDAVICWHDSNEQFTVPDYIRANCEYPGKWDGEIQRTEKIDIGTVIVTKIFSAIVTKIFSAEISVFVTSFIKLDNGKISRLDEYYSECGEAPKWRQDMKIGKPKISDSLFIERQ